MEISMVDIGKRIKARRLELGLTQTTIYERCGISSGTLSRFEQGINAPSIIAFHKLANALECDMTWLATGSSANMQSNHLSDCEKKILSDYQLLSSKDREDLLEIASMIIRKYINTSGGGATTSSPLPHTDLDKNKVG